MPRPLKIAVYSHDAMGLGHMRRNTLVARELARCPGPTSVLLIAGAPELGAFPLPPDVDTITLPPLSKNPDSTYVPRNTTLPVAELIALRSHIIHAAVQSFAPDLLLVDKVPRGLGGELDATLNDRTIGAHTRVVLGLRDILDDPLSVQMEWQRDGYETVLRDRYDAIWVYGDPAVYDPLHEYDWSGDICGKVWFTGYLNPGSRLGSGEGVFHAEVEAAPVPYVLCIVGGGQDGGDLATAFAAAPRPPHLHAVVLCGPFMPDEDRARLHRQAVEDPGLRVFDFVNDPGPLLRGADAVVTMGGYNAVTEVVALGRPALVVPRVAPRTEQLIRARRFEDLGLLRMLHPRHATPERIGEWLRAPDPDPIAVEHAVDFGGLDRIPGLLRGIFPGEADGPMTTTGGSAR